MAFDPNLPQEDSPLDAAQMRGQLTALKALIDGVPTSPAMQDELAAQTAGNCAGVDELNLTVSNTFNRAEIQAIVDKLNEALSQLKRE